MSLNYITQYDNELNSNSQIRRSTDMQIQRGATFEVILTGDTYISSMELDTDLYINDIREARITVTPYSVTEDTGIFTYKFNIRPYNFLGNFLQAEHHQHLWLYDWNRSNTDINLNNPYTNIIKWNMKYGYRYVVEGFIVKEYDSLPENDYDHYTSLPLGFDSGDTAENFTNTGEFFNLVGGSFQMDEKYLQRNEDQEVYSSMSGQTINTLDINRGLSPMSQFLMDYPSVPEDSETSRFLTDSPRIQYIQESENHTLYFLNGLTGDRQWLEGTMVFIEFYDENNNRIDYTYNRTYAEVPTTGYTNSLTLTMMPCGPADISTLYENMDWTNVSYYTVQVTTGEIEPIAPVSEVMYFYLKENCKQENTRLTFLNQRGGYDYFTFTSFRDDTKKIDRDTFNNRYYSTNIASADRNVGRTVKQFDSNVTQEIVLETDYLTVAESNWLEQLFTSPQVYEIKGNYVSPLDNQDKIYKDLRPVTVLSTEVKKYNKNHQRLNKYRVTLSVANNYFVSRGF